DRMLVIDAEECIDCGACEPECPVEAILPEDAIPNDWEPFVKINYAFSGDKPDLGKAEINELVQAYADEKGIVAGQEAEGGRTTTGAAWSWRAGVASRWGGAPSVSRRQRGWPPATPR